MRVIVCVVEMLLPRVLRLRRRVRLERLLLPEAAAAGVSQTRALSALASRSAALRTPAAWPVRQLSSEARPAQVADEKTRAALVLELKTLVNAMRNDLRAPPTTEQTVANWEKAVAHWRQHAAADALADQLRVGYESAVAVAAKQRQFDLARALVAQMKAFGYAPTDTTVQFLVRGVALELLARPSATPADDLRAMLSDATWERDLLEVVRAEEYPHHRKTPLERHYFQQQLLDGVEVLLDEYEASHALADRSPLPYNEALRVYADNEVPFARMLKLMVKRSIKPDADTYVALLQGARWSEIPATINQLLQSGLADKLTVAGASPTAVEASSHVVHAIWSSTMKAVLHSYKSRFFDRKEHVSHSDVEELKKVFLYAEKQLSLAFPGFQFATTQQHEAVYTLRAKAAATVGLQTSVMRTLDDYVRLAPAGTVLKKDAFLSALELYTSWQLKILLLPREEVFERTTHRDVARSPRVSEIDREYRQFADKLLPASVAKLEKMTLDVLTNRQEVEAQKQLVAANTRAEKALKQRLEHARIVKSYQLLIQEQFERADSAVIAIQGKMLDAVKHADDALIDVDVQLKLMEQYMTCANRFEQRLRSRQKEVAPQIMRRVFRVVKEVTAKEVVGELDQEKLQELFHLAIRTAVLYWRFEEADKLVHQRKKVLRTRGLDEREYELLIFREVTDRNIRGAYGLVQEMHNAGVAPSKEAIHRIVLGVMHMLHKYPEASAASSTPAEGAAADDLLDVPAAKPDNNEKSAETDKEAKQLTVSDSQTIEEELLFRDELQFDGDHDDRANVYVLGSGAPSSLVDLAGFLQDWYNLHGIRPAAKTVVPVLARLLAAKDFPEFMRLLQILESMDGGLTPATTVWLEKRLERVGKTLDDFRVRTAKSGRR